MSKILSCTGRIIGGKPMVYKRAMFDGKELVTQAGDPKFEEFIRFAVPKTDPGGMEIVNAIEAVRTAHPQGTLPTFSVKYHDGDLAHNAGKANFAGNWVFDLTCNRPAKYYKNNPAGLGEADVLEPNPLPGHPNPVKSGDYVKVFIDITPNAEKAALYLSADAVILMQSGEALDGQKTAAETALDINAAMGVVAAPPAAAPPAAAPPAAAPPAAPAPPAPDVVAAAAGPALNATLTAQGHTIASMIASGWTMETLATNGHLA